LGCKILNVNKILHFEKKEVIFKEYIESMYSYRKNSILNIDNLIYKLLMNSLYGRFGMNYIFEETKLIDFNYIYYYELLLDIKYKYGNLLTYNYNLKEINRNFNILKNLNFNANDLNIIESIKNSLYKKTSNINVAVQISSAISGYSRIELLKSMYHQLNNGGKIYYYDTDSIFTNKPLPEELVDIKKIGKFKLEYEIKEGIFLSPKNYAIITKNNKELIKFK
jgi:hypothetical protein